MSRKEYSPLSGEQIAWLRRWAARQGGVLERVLGGMRLLGYDGGERTYRQVYDAKLALDTLAAGRPALGVWAVPGWTGVAPPLSDGQRNYLHGVAADAAWELRRVAEYFDHAGAPDRQLAHAVRAAADQLGAIKIHLHYLSCHGSAGKDPKPDRPSDPSIDCGAGI